MLLTKLAGGGLILVGLAFMFVFPDWNAESAYQPKQFAYTAVLIGLILIIAGAWLVLT